MTALGRTFIKNLLNKLNSIFINVNFLDQFAPSKVEVNGAHTSGDFLRVLRYSETR
jgi:hypothetical protein